MLPIRNTRALTAAAAAALLLVAAPSAMAARGSLSGSINPNKGPIGSPIKQLNIGFTVDPDDASREAPTLSKVDLFFPPNARTNGAKFPVCSPETINARRSFSGCPKGSKIGRGDIIADVPAADVNHVPAIMTVFNGAGGKSVTINIEAHNPVEIFQAFKAPLTKTSGRFGYHLSAPIPQSLQEINDGWFAEVRTLKSTIGATWRGTPYIQTTTACPKSLRVPIAARLAFMNRTPADAPMSLDSSISCRR
jgi:hypothetical protein